MVLLHWLFALGIFRRRFKAIGRSRRKGRICLSESLRRAGTAAAIPAAPPLNIAMSAFITAGFLPGTDAVPPQPLQSLLE